MKTQLLGLLLLVAAGALVWFALNPEKDLAVFKPSKPLTFSAFVSEDLAHMRKKNLLPAPWASIQYVTYNYNSDFQRELINNEKIKIKDGPAGRYRLEIEFIDVPDDENPALILQYSLFELASNNKVWELGKTYSLGSFIAKKADSSKSEKPKDPPAQPQAAAPAEQNRAIPSVQAPEQSPAPLEKSTPEKAAAPSTEPPKGSGPAQ